MNYFVKKIIRLTGHFSRRSMIEVNRSPLKKMLTKDAKLVEIPLTLIKWKIISHSTIQSNIKDAKQRQNKIRF